MKLNGSKELMRQINKKYILKKIFFEGYIDRASLVRASGLSGGTVTKIVSELIEDKLLMEIGEGDSSGGRKPILLRINPDRGCITGIKIGVGYLKFSVSNLAGEILFSKEMDTGSSFTPDDLISTIIVFLSEVLPEHGIDIASVIGIGIASSGVVDTKRGIIKDSFLLNWKDVEISEMVKKETGVNCYVMNDVDSFAKSHLWKGNASEYKNSIFLTLGTGIGGAITTNGNLHWGSGGVGEIGHMTVSKNGTPCSCGSSGCLESEISFGALVNKIIENSECDELHITKDKLKNNESFEMEFIRKSISLDHRTAEKIFAEMAILLGIAIKNLINILAPEYFLIGGEGLEFKDMFLAQSIEYAKNNCFGRLADDVVFEIDTLGKDAWIMGCIYRVIEKELFDGNMLKK